MNNSKSVFVRESNGPLGEIRYREIARQDVHTARIMQQVLERAGHQVVVQSDRRPPHSY